MELTKEQRNEVYTLAYENYLIEITNSRYCGICTVLYGVMLKFDYCPILNDYTLIPNYLPELNLFKNDKTFWWDRRETEPRINAFKEMINLTK